MWNDTQINIMRGYFEVSTDIGPSIFSKTLISYPEKMFPFY